MHKNLYQNVYFNTIITLKMSFLPFLSEPILYIFHAKNLYIF